MMDTNALVDFFNQPAFVIFGGITSIISIIAILSIVVSVITGVSPALWRLGLGLSRRKIAVFAQGDHYKSLEALLQDSGLFKSKNIVHIPLDSLGKAAEFSLFLLWWKDCEDQIEEILRQKKDSTALIVYAPQEEGFLAPEMAKKINNQRNALLVNFRGRLLSDILVFMMTTGRKVS